MMYELTEQGFTEEERNWMYQNEKGIAESCVYFNNTTIIPNQLFIPDFPGVDVKVEIPKLAKETMNKMYGPNPDPKIIERLDFELEKVALKDFEFIYYISRKIVEQSEELGFKVGSRGSVGSSFLALMVGISDNNALDPHYVCPECFEFEWSIDEKIVNGLDLPDKKCPKCGHMMWNDGFSGDLTSFLGSDFTKIPDVDLNLAGEVQKKVQDEVVKWMDGFAYGSATPRVIRSDFLKTNLLSKLPNIEGLIADELDDEGQIFDLNYLGQKCSGTADSFGTHPGGIVTLGVIKDDDGNSIDHNLISPAILPNDNPAARPALLFSYHSIEMCLSKSDILGHNVPKTLKILEDISGIDSRDRRINVNDKKLYKVLLDISEMGSTQEEKDRIRNAAAKSMGNLGLPELSTSYIGEILKALKVGSLADIVSVNGISHGSGIWLGENGQKECLEKGILTREDVFDCRENVHKMLSNKGNIDSNIAFQLVEKLRKGKKLKEAEKDIIMSCDLKTAVKRNILNIGYLFPLAGVYQAWAN